MQLNSLHLMTHEKNFLLHYRHLWNVYAVDAAVKIEMEKLLFLKLNQRKLHADKDTHFKDSMLNDSDCKSGQRVILPFSIGSELSAHPKKFEEHVR